MKSLTKLFLFALSIFVYGCNSLDIKPLDIITDGDILSSDYEIASDFVDEKLCIHKAVL